MKECNQCGKCCIKYSDGALSASTEEIESWGIFRPDIAAYVKNGAIWFDPNSGKKLTRCPFLMPIDPSSKTIKYGCNIYHDRPEDCRLYPSNIDEMIHDQCEMIEARDLKNQKHAQKQLDIIMSDSHK